jgi:hypothetical protein
VSSRQVRGEPELHLAHAPMHPPATDHRSDGKRSGWKGIVRCMHETTGRSKNDDRRPGRAVITSQVIDTGTLRSELGSDRQRPPDH